MIFCAAHSQYRAWPGPASSSCLWAPQHVSAPNHLPLSCPTDSDPDPPTASATLIDTSDRLHSYIYMWSVTPPRSKYHTMLCCYVDDVPSWNMLNQESRSLLALDDTHKLDILFQWQLSFFVLLVCVQMLWVSTTQLQHSCAWKLWGSRNRGQMPRGLCIR